MEKTAAIIMAETTTPRLLTADFSLCTLAVSLPGRAEHIEAALTPGHIARLRETVAREGLIRGRLIYALGGRRRVIDLDSGRARWAGEGRPEPCR